MLLWATRNRGRLDSVLIGMARRTPTRGGSERSNPAPTASRRPPADTAVGVAGHPRLDAAAYATAIRRTGRPSVNARSS
jgi:hypothetical protein